MPYKDDIICIKTDIEKNLGVELKLQCGRGAHQTIIDNCKLVKAYPDVFIVQSYQGAMPYRKLCFSYTDVITNAVRLIYNN
jgi:uncharacterized protein Veg